MNCEISVWTTFFQKKKAQVLKNKKIEQESNKQKYQMVIIIVVLGIFFKKNTNRNISKLLWRKVVYAFWCGGNYQYSFTGLLPLMGKSQLFHCWESFEFSQIK